MPLDVKVRVCVIGMGCVLFERMGVCAKNKGMCLLWLAVVLGCACYLTDVAHILHRTCSVGEELLLSHSCSKVPSSCALHVRGAFLVLTTGFSDQSREKFNSTRTVDRSSGAGLLPLPGHGLHSLPINITRKGGEAKKWMARKPAEQWVGNPLSKPASVLPILQRPKHKKAADELIAKSMMKADGAK